MTLKERYEAVVLEYLKKFEKKQGVEFDGWVGNDIGGVAAFISQYFFNFDEIRYDIDNNCKKGLITQWQDDYTEHGAGAINYKSYAMGLRFEDLKHESL